jgi:tetratricopeptide (TPR) repeat protein
LQLCADLVRHLDASNRAGSQAGIIRLAALLPQRTHASPADVVDFLARVVSQILGELPPRQRAILERCDVHDENATAVAKALNISRRHLYRERRTALCWIAQKLMTDAPPSPFRVMTVEGDRYFDRIALSQALENGGRWRQAADMLERLAEESADPDQRALIEIQLAYLYLRADRLAMARDRVEITRELARRARAGREWREAEADAAAASIALSAWDMRAAVRLAHRSALQLESWASGTGEIRVHNALTNALIVEADVVLGQGAIESARVLADKARDITKRNERIDRRIRIEVQANAAALDIFSGRRFEEAERELKECYRQALLFGLTNSAIIVAAELAGTYRRQGRPETAIDVCSALSEVAQLGDWRDRKRLLYELSNAYIEMGDLPAASIHVAALSEAVVGIASRQGPAQLTIARFHLALRSWAPALLAAEAAETSYAQLGSERLVGETLLLQVRALVGLGELTRARRLMTAATRLIEMTNSDGRIAVAYKLMAQLSGEVKYAAAARRLLRNSDSKERLAPSPRSAR